MHFRKTNMDPSVHFRKANTAPSMHFRKDNTDPSMPFKKVNTEFLLPVILLTFLTISLPGTPVFTPSIIST